MKIHASALNITSELRKKLSLKVQYFFMKIPASALNLTSELRKKKNFDSVRMNMTILLGVSDSSHRGLYLCTCALHTGNK